MPRDSKTLGAYFTPEAVAAALVHWAARDPTDRLLDPSSAAGRFVALHANSIGVERYPVSVAEAGGRVPHAMIVEAEFFRLASDDNRRFHCAAGNPPFLRYERFKGATRRAAFEYYRRLGVTFSALSSSSAPLIVAAANELHPGGRIAVVVPAEIGHAPYAVPLLDHQVSYFGTVQAVAVNEKVFPRLSEDCWLLFADNARCRPDDIRLSKVERFVPDAMPPTVSKQTTVDAWRPRWRGRSRSCLLPQCVRSTYGRMAADLGLVGLIHVRAGQPTLTIPRSLRTTPVRGVQGGESPTGSESTDGIGCLTLDWSMIGRRPAAREALAKRMKMADPLTTPSFERPQGHPEAPGFDACVEPSRITTRSAVSLACPGPAMRRSTRSDSSTQPDAPPGCYRATRPEPARPPTHGAAPVAINVTNRAFIGLLRLSHGPQRMPIINDNARKPDRTWPGDLRYLHLPVYRGPHRTSTDRP